VASDLAAGPDLPVSRRGDSRLPLRQLAFWALGGLFLCFVLRELRVGDDTGLLQRVALITLFPWGVFAVAFWRLAQMSPLRRARHADLGLVLIAALACIPLMAEVSLAGLGLVIGLVGTWAIWRGRDEAGLRAAGICLLALCTNFAVAPLLFRLGYAQFIGFDLALLQAAIDISEAPVTVTPGGLVAADGLRVTLVGACSSFTGVSAAVLVHMGWAMSARTTVTARDALAVLATVCIATLINILRLTLAASGHESFAFWHGAAGETPPGGQIFWVLHHAVLLTGGYLSASWAGARPGHRRGAAA
jgi:hypothetical protein